MDDIIEPQTTTILILAILYIIILEAITYVIQRTIRLPKLTCTN
jgi:hypothetical protein